MTTGGYRPGSGRAKSGYYKGIYCGSTYELCWVIYNLDHNIIFSRFPGKLENNGTVYYPDFLLADKKTIIETKGYESPDKVDKKTKVAEHFGFTVKILRKDDLQYAFDYVMLKYNTKQFYTLYDGYKPKYSYNCSYCHSIFHSNGIKNTLTKFCSRVCAGKYRKKANCPEGKMSQETKDKISKSLIGKKMQPYQRKYKQMWINNGVNNTRIRITDPIPYGYSKGKIKSL